MLKRNDLAKQFELVVKQEILNFNKNLETIFHTLNSLKEGIESVEKTVADNAAKLACHQKYLEIEIELVKRSLMETQARFNRHVNDAKVTQEDNSNHFQQLHIKVDQKITSTDEISKDLNGFKKQLASCQLSILTHIKNVDQGFDQLGARFKKEIQASRDEIMAIPSDAQEIRKELNAKINTHIVDVEGLLREIRLNRSDLHIVQKKIENIYTLIERLKKREVLP